MANKRMIASDIFDDEFFAALDHFERLIWIGLFAVVADDQGRMLDSPALIRSKVFPYDEQVTVEQVEAALVKMNGQLTRYEADGKKLIQMVNWWKYQAPSWATPSKYPAPPLWTDRIKCHAAGNKIITKDWDKAGGYLEGERPGKLEGFQFYQPEGYEDVPSPLPSELPSPLPSEQGSWVHSEEGSDLPSGIEEGESKSKGKRRMREGEVEVVQSRRSRAKTSTSASTIPKGKKFTPEHYPMIHPLARAFENASGMPAELPLFERAEEAFMAMHRAGVKPEDITQAVQELRAKQYVIIGAASVVTAAIACMGKRKKVPDERAQSAERSSKYAVAGVNS